MKGYNDNLKNSQVPLNFNNIRDQYNSTNPLNNQDKDLSSLNSSMIDISEYMNSIKEEEYKSYIKKKYDIIVRTFQEIDTNKDSSIDFNELITYLNKGMTNGNKFDPEIARKIFDMIDINHDNKCSLNEFAKTYIQVEEELKMQLLKQRAKHEQKNTNLNKLKLEAQKYKNERMLEKNLSDNAKLFVSILSVSFRTKNPKYQNIFINLKYRDNTKNTSVLSTSHDLIWNENFEYNVQSLKDQLTLDIRDYLSKDNSVTIGHVNIPFDEVEDQDEFECEIEIPDEIISDQYTGSIKLKIQLIKSYYKLYNDLVLKTEAECNQFLEDIKKIYDYFETLNQPFNYFREVNQDPKYKKFCYKSYFDSNEDEAANNLEISQVEKLSKYTIRTLDDTEVPLEGCGFTLITFIFFFIAIICLVHRTDFFSLGGLGLIWIMALTQYRYGKKKYLNFYIIILLSVLLIDFIWAMLSYEEYTGKINNEGVEMPLKKISVWLFLIELVLKLILLFMFIVQRCLIKKKNEPLLV